MDRSLNYHYFFNMKNTLIVLNLCFATILMANINDVNKREILSTEDITKRFIESVKSIPYLNEKSFTIVEASRDKQFGIKSAKFLENGIVLNQRIKFDYFQSTRFSFHEADRNWAATFYVFQLQNIGAVREAISGGKDSGPLITKSPQYYKLVLIENFLCIVVIEDGRDKGVGAILEALQKFMQKKMTHEPTNGSAHERANPDKIGSFPENIFRKMRKI